MNTEGTTTTGNDPHEHPGSDLELRILAPREPEPRTFTFHKSTLVGDAARTAADDFGYKGGSPTLQNAAGDLLDRNQPLAGQHVKDHDELDLVDVGGGV